MNNHTSKLANKKSALLIIVVVFVGVATAIGIMLMQPKPEVAVTRTVEFSALHPTYTSIKQLISADDVAYVGQATLLDDGTVRSDKVSDEPDEGPPMVETDYTLAVKSIIKGKNIPSKITISVMGGVVGDTRYLVVDIPKLHKGDNVIVFASLGRDGKYYPLAGGSAIAIQDGSSKYSLSADVISTGAVTFSEKDIK